MSSKSRQIAKNIGKSIKRKFEADFFQFPLVIEDEQADIDHLDLPSVTISPEGSPNLSGHRRMYQTAQGAQRPPKKSMSMGTIATMDDDNQDPTVMDHEDIIALTQDVKRFSDSLAKLKLMFTDGLEAEEDTRVVIHEGLGEVLSILNPVMQHYPDLQSPDIFTAARGLISLIKDHDYESGMTSASIQSFCDAIDQLALAFSSSVSEYLMGDLGPQLVMDLKARSMNNIAVEETIPEKPPREEDAAYVPAEDLDNILVSMESGLALALQRAKVWSKYISDIIAYIEKKAQLELDYAKNLSRLAHNLQHSLKKEGFLPLQSIYCTSLNQDTEFASNLQATQSLLQSQRFIEPLSVRRSEHDKVYKSVKDVWHREHRKMTESVTNLRKAQALYNSRQQDRERAHEVAIKAESEKQEKRRKAEEEAIHKAAEAETTYKACVAEANFRQQELFKVKNDQLARIREQIHKCDQVIKEVTVEYFQLYHSILSPLPLQFLTLSESSKNYTPGSQYAEYVRRLPGQPRPCQPVVFMFEPYVQGQKSTEGDRKESVHSNGSVSELHSPEGSPVASPRRDKYRIPVKAWGQQGQAGTSDTDSASCSSKSHESSPSGSPHRGQRRLVTSHSLDELTEEELLAGAASSVHKEKRAQHMKRMASMQGAEGTELPGLFTQNRNHRRNTTFGVDFQEQVDTFQTKIPPIVSKCLEEIEKRGNMVKGIYRVSGVKSKVEHLCQRFDIDPEAVDLSDVHPNIISNVLKLYLRQLPEPLLTFRLYAEFIHAAKENMSGQLVGGHLIEKLQKLIIRLPSSNLRTSAVLLHHLQRVANHSDVNQMSASNLGIVFGPTLLRPLEGSASLASLVDTPHQTRAVELLITHAHLVFGPSEDFQVAPSQTPVEPLDQAVARNAAAGITESSSAYAADVDTSVTDEEAKIKPSSCEFVLPGMANEDRHDSQIIALNDIEGTESDEDDEAPDIPLPDKSLPQTDPLSVPLSPQCIQDGTQRELPSRGSQDSSTSMPSELSSSLTQPRTEVSKSASSPSVSDQCSQADAEKEKSPEQPTEKKKPHSQVLKNIKYLTKAPSFDVVDEFYPKTTFVPRELSPQPPTSAKSSTENISSTSTKDGLSPNITIPKIDELQSSQDTQSSTDVQQQNEKLVSTKLASSSTPHLPSFSSNLATSSAQKQPSSSSIQLSNSRRSILEEMPIPTVNHPQGSTSSDNGVNPDAAMTIPASPTIKRRELASIQSKIPTSPGTQRAADSREGDRFDKFRQQQRKLVTAIKSDTKIGPTIVPSKDAASQEKVTGECTTSVPSVADDNVKKSKGKPPTESSKRSSAVMDDGFSGGCALSSRPNSQSEDSLDPENRASSGKESQEKPKHNVAAVAKKRDSPSLVIRGSKPSGPIEQGSPKQRYGAGVQSSVPTIKSKSFNLPTSQSSPKRPLSGSGTHRASATPSSPTGVSVVKRTPSSTSSEQSTKSSGKAVRAARSAGLKKAYSEDSSSSGTTSATSSPAAAASNNAGARGSEQTSPSQKANRVPVCSEGKTTPKKDETDGNSMQTSLTRQRYPSGDGNSKPTQRKTASLATPTGSPRKVHDRCQDKSSGKPSSPATQASSKTPVTSATVSATSGSHKLSQDRTPRFV